MSFHFKILLICAALVLALAACGPQRAPEFQGIERWVNSPGLTLEQLQGKVVLIDFWTYSCVNCIRTLSYLRDWHDKYSPHGLVIVGVHTPEFDFEKLPENVSAATQDFGLEYPVALDNDYRTWNSYGVNAWPTKFLLDHDGNIRYGHRGEGGYAETEEAIRELLENTGADLSVIQPHTGPDPDFVDAAFAADPAQRITRELYAGYNRNPSLPSSAFGTLVGGIPSYIMDEGYYQKKDTDILYQEPGERFNHFIYLQGLWNNGPESVTHARETTGFQDYVGIKFFATSVNAVMSAPKNRSITVKVTLDGGPLTSSQAGQDIEFDQAGNSVVVVDEPRLYGLVELDAFASHNLEISPRDAGFALFTFTFGAYEEGP